MFCFSRERTRKEKAQQVEGLLGSASPYFPLKDIRNISTSPQEM